MDKEFDITTIQALYKAISEILGQAQFKVCYLSGDLGVGKTTFVRSFLDQLGFHGEVVSPSYSLVQRYEVRGVRVIHSDLYRLSSADELLHLDVEDWLDEANFIFIEWPEKGQGVLPAPDALAMFSLEDKKRTLRFKLC